MARIPSEAEIDTLLARHGLARESDAISEMRERFAEAKRLTERFPKPIQPAAARQVISAANKLSEALVKNGVGNREDIRALRKIRRRMKPYQDGAAGMKEQSGKRLAFLVFAIHAWAEIGGGFSE